MKPHFFKASSRLGIRYLPHGSKEFAFGVEDAPDAILTPEFLSKFNKYRLSEFVFTKPEKLPGENYLDLVLKESLDFTNFILSNLDQAERLVVIGGDHSVTFPSLLADLERYGDMGIIHFDSHADFNLYKESPSKNFHGMYLRIFFDKFDLPKFDLTFSRKLKSSNLFFIGDLELDSGERSIFHKLRPSVLTRRRMLEDKNKALGDLEKFVKKHKHIHISFDVDVFEKELVSATGTPSKAGFKEAEIFEILEIIKNNARSFTLDVCEVNPTKKEADQTIKIAQEVIVRMID